MVKILDLSCDVAGRFGAKLFAQDGVEVLRCAPELPEPASLTAYLDCDKKAIGRERFERVLCECDVAFTSFDCGKFQGYAAGLGIPTDCIHVTTSSFGMTGPYAHWRGGSIADWAAGGYLFISGDPNREPLCGPENMCAYAAGYTAALGAEAALIDRMRTGRSRHLDISVMETMLLQHQSTFARTAAGELRRRTGRYTEVYPLTVRPCRDGYISIGVVTDAEFDKFAIAIERPDLSADPRFADKDARWENRDALDAEMAPWLEAHDADDVVQILQDGGVACAAVAGPVDITRNPQLLSREYWREAACGGVMPGNPLAHFHGFGGKRGRLGLGQAGELPLAGVRVLDFTIFWAGPSTTRALADLGADVVWVEQPGARMDCMIEPGRAVSPVETMMHLYDTKMFRGKRSIALDLRKPEDRAVAHALAREAHVVVENFRPGIADRLGVGAGDLSRINPALTYVSLSGWGASGPWRERRSYGPSIEAASSISGRTGYPGGEPLRLGHAFPDATGGLAGGLASARGLRRAMETGRGGWYDISQLEAYLAMSGEGIVEATGFGCGRERVGNRSKLGALQGVFPCKGEDQWIAIRLENDEDCTRFTGFSGGTVTMASDPDDVEPVIAAYTARHEKLALAADLQSAGIQAFAALDAHELASDPHLWTRGYFLSVLAGDKSHAMPGTPLVATPRMADATSPAPRPGEHSDEVRGEIAAFGQPQ